MGPRKHSMQHSACVARPALPLEPRAAAMLLSSDAHHTVEQPPWGELLDLAEAMRDLADRATTAEGLPALDDLVNLAVERVPSARWASLTVLRAKKFRTEATTDQGATKADVLQYEMGFGPCVDAVLDDSVYVSGDVAGDERWLEWGARVHDELGVRSVLSQRLRLSGDAGVIAGLNIYSARRRRLRRARPRDRSGPRHPRRPADEHHARQRPRTEPEARAREQPSRSGSPSGSSCTSTGSARSRPSTSCAQRARTPTASSRTSQSRSSTPAP